MTRRDRSRRWQPGKPGRPPNAVRAARKSQQTQPVKPAARPIGLGPIDKATIKMVVELLREGAAHMDPELQARALGLTLAVLAPILDRMSAGLPDPEE